MAQNDLELSPKNLEKKFLFKNNNKNDIKFVIPRKLANKLYKL